MSDLRKMLDEFENKYVYIQSNGYTTGVRKDNESIYRILSAMIDRIETIEHEAGKIPQAQPKEAQV